MGAHLREVDGAAWVAAWKQVSRILLTLGAQYVTECTDLLSIPNTFLPAHESDSHIAGSWIWDSVRIRRVPMPIPDKVGSSAILRPDLIDCSEKRCQLSLSMCSGMRFTLLKVLPSCP